MPLLIAVTGVILLLILITVFKLDAFLSFVLVCLFVGLAMGLPVEEIITALTRGIGDTLGMLVLILGFGAMLGKILADSGAAQQITRTLVHAIGIRRVHWALMIAAFIVGIPMFYAVGFVILIPIVFTLAASTGLPLIFVAIPVVASLSVTHGLLPPHPAPTALADMFGAQMGQVLFLGLILSVPVILIAGPLLAKRFKTIKASPFKEFTGKEVMDESELPPAFISILAALLPVLLIGLGEVAGRLLQPTGILHKISTGIGHPVLAMLISVFFALFALGVRKGRKMEELMKDMAHSVSSIAMLLLIMAGAGALKEILVSTGISDYLGELLRGSGASPLLLGWLIAALIRVAVGSATVAAMTAASLILPLLSDPSVSPELMVLAIGSGSLILSHVNDTGFWLFKEYFSLSIKDTLLTWTLMETVVAITGLGGVLLMNIII